GRGKLLVEGLKGMLDRRHGRSRKYAAMGRARGVVAAVKGPLRTAAILVLVAGSPTAVVLAGGAGAQPAETDVAPIRPRNLDVSREGAAELPRSEDDQALVEGWPLYRTDRGQAAFNDAMATLKATNGAAPGREAFKDCAELQCNLSLPPIGSDGWMQP